MSRNYEVQVEVFPCAPEEHPSIKALSQWGMTIDCDTETFDHEDRDGWSYWGSIQLVGGQTEEDKHEELRQLLPLLSITTRWRWVDDQPWDETFLSDPLTPAA